ncbi:MAG: glycosyltransferase [Chloroflexi bacterium]|nr:glycosyltransferase [Chloroflexota bacterium]
MKLAFFVDQIFWQDNQTYSSDEAYTLFPISFRSAFHEVVLIGRLAPEPGRKPYVLPAPAVTLCPLPYYPSVFASWKQGPQLRNQIRRIVEAHAPDWDVVLICGPNPMGEYIAKLCIELGKPVALVVRQNLVPQVRFANRGIKRMVGVGIAMWLEWRFRRLARGRTVFAVGQEMTDAYRAVTQQVHNHFACLIDEAQMATLAAVTPQAEPDRLLFVGRLSTEKGLHFLLAALTQLKARGKCYGLDIVGTGPLEAELRAKVVALGLADQVKFLGYIAYGEALLQLYQKAIALLVPSLSGEGFPQVINEALAVGVPVIASMVGGIPAFITHGQTGLLVPPGSVPALASAIEQLVENQPLRRQFGENGRALMRDNTLEANRDRMIEAIKQEVLLKNEVSYAPQ